MGVFEHSIRDHSKIIDAGEDEVICNMCALRCGGKFNLLSYAMQVLYYQWTCNFKFDLDVQLVWHFQVCAVYGEAASIDNYALEPLKQGTDGTDVFSNTKKLIEDLVANLRKAAQQAADAMAVFAAGLKEQVRLCQEKLYIEIGKLKEKVSLAIKNVSDRFSNASSAVKECIEVSIMPSIILFFLASGFYLYYR